MDSGEDEVEPSEPKPQWPEPKYAEARLEFYAKLAWLPDYTEVYLLEAELNGAYADVEEHSSEYRRQQVAAGEDAARQKSMLSSRTRAASPSQRSSTWSSSAGEGRRAVSRFTHARRGWAGART